MTDLLGESLMACLEWLGRMVPPESLTAKKTRGGGLRGNLLDCPKRAFAGLRCELSGDPALLWATGQSSLKGEPPYGRKPGLATGKACWTSSHKIHRRCCPSEVQPARCQTMRLGKPDCSGKGSARNPPRDPKSKARAGLSAESWDCGAGLSC